MAASRALHLIRRPDGMPRPGDFKLTETTVAEPRENEVLVDNLYLSVDPATRPRLTRGQELDTPVMGFALGRVTQSRHKDFAESDVVQSGFGYRERFVSD